MKDVVISRNFGYTLILPQTIDIYKFFNEGPVVSYAIHGEVLKEFGKEIKEALNRPIKWNFDNIELDPPYLTTMFHSYSKPFTSFELFIVLEDGTRVRIGKFSFHHPTTTFPSRSTFIKNLLSSLLTQNHSIH